MKQIFPSVKADTRAASPRSAAAPDKSKPRPNKKTFVNEVKNKVK